MSPLFSKDRGADVPIERLEVLAYQIPTDFQPEQDGTLTWDSTTINVVKAQAQGAVGYGYTYGHSSIARFVDDKLSSSVVGNDALAVQSAWRAMVQTSRNNGYTGQTMMAISAVDVALWDLKARLLDQPLVTLLDGFHDAVPIYGSGGFTSYPIDRLKDQIAHWMKQGFNMVKIKVGRNPDEDIDRVLACREVMGEDVELFVDANGAYDRKEALKWARQFSDLGVSWLEEPVTSDDLEGLRLLRDRGPEGLDITAGEYGFNPTYFAHMIDAGAVDVIQPDVTRCGGITSLLMIGGLCQSHHVPVSGHTAPSIHAHALCAVLPVRHLEYFHDHVRIENMAFDGVLEPDNSALRPDRSRPGLGIELKERNLHDYLTYAGSS